VITGLAFHWHLLAIVTLVVAGVLYDQFGSRTLKPWRAYTTLVVTAAVTLWPMGDLATSVSLSAITVQRLVLMLLTAPALLRAIPISVMDRITKPAPIDGLLRVLTRPFVAIAVVTVLGAVLVSPPVVDAAATSGWVHDIVLASVFVSGLLFWLPPMGVVPGMRRLSPVANAGYLFVGSVVVTILSFVWIFARQPLYPGLHHQHEILGVSPVFDVQLAGFIAKFGAYVPLWTIAFTRFARAGDEDRPPPEESPLHWADVERQLSRIDRARRRQARRSSSDGVDEP
jgi:putative membrane protein